MIKVNYGDSTHRATETFKNITDAKYFIKGLKKGSMRSLDGFYAEIEPHTLKNIFETFNEAYEESDRRKSESEPLTQTSNLIKDLKHFVVLYDGQIGYVKKNTEDHEIIWLRKY